MAWQHDFRHYIENNLSLPYKQLVLTDHVFH